LFASAFDEVTEFVISSIVGLAPSDEKQTSRWVMCLGYDWPAALYATEDDFHLLITSGNGASHGVDEEHVKCTAHQIPNEFRIAHQPRRQSLSQAVPFEASGAVLSSRISMLASRSSGAFEFYDPSQHVCATDHFIPAR
jgi:hypothetical protein